MEERWKGRGDDDHDGDDDEKAFAAFFLATARCGSCGARACRVAFVRRERRESAAEKKRRREEERGRTRARSGKRRRRRSFWSLKGFRVPRAAVALSLCRCRFPPVCAFALSPPPPPPSEKHQRFFRFFAHWKVFLPLSSSLLSFSLFSLFSLFSPSRRVALGPRPATKRKPAALAGRGEGEVTSLASLSSLAPLSSLASLFSRFSHSSSLLSSSLLRVALLSGLDRE